MQKTNKIIKVNKESFPLIDLCYLFLFADCSIRTRNVLNKYQATFNNIEDFYYSILKISSNDIRQFRNCGVKTTEEIINLVNRLKVRVEEMQTESYQPPVELVSYQPPIELVSYQPPIELESYLPLVLHRANILSPRAKNAFLSFFNKHLKFRK